MGSNCTSGVKTFTHMNDFLFFDGRYLFWSDNSHGCKPDLGGADIIFRHGLTVASKFIQIFFNYLNYASAASGD